MNIFPFLKIKSCICFSLNLSNVRKKCTHVLKTINSSKKGTMKKQCLSLEMLYNPS